MRIYISGVHSGPNPSPGIGIARSLRAGFPRARLVAVDYSAGSSGLLWPDFNEHIVRPPWHDVELRSHASFVASVLAQGGIWISGLDLELQLLARYFRSRRNLPFPPGSALGMSAKPPVQLGKLLDFPIPPFLAFAGSSDEGLSRFCRLHGWPIWVKGPEYDAVPVWSWYEMAPVVQRLSRAWGGRDRLFLQAHVEGQDVTMAFAAWEGKLLGAAFLEKLDRTYEGKAWSGRVSRLPGDLEHALRKFVRATRWSGGGEIECVRDPQLRLWLLECNPRFPAWIYGATQAGLNLPAMLVQAVTRRRAVASRKTRSETFTRVVLEVPAGA